MRTETEVEQTDARVQGRTDAVVMLEAARSDPQMQLPEHPALVPGVLWINTDVGVAFEGTASRQVVRGTSAAALLPRLLPLLDGTKTCDEIAVALGMATSDAEAAVALLHSCGLIIGSLEIPSGLDEGTGFAVARLLDTTRVWRSVTAAYEELAAEPLVVVGSGGAIDDVVTMLERSGDVVVRIAPGQALPSGCMVLVDASDRRGFAETYRRAMESDARLVGFEFFGTGAWISPEFGGANSPCLDCFLDALSGLALLNGSDDSSLSPGRHRMLAASMVALELFHQRIRIGTPLAATSCVVHDFDGGRTQQFLIGRAPGCASSHRGEDVPEQAGRVALYDQAAGFPGRKHIATKGHQSHYKPSNLKLQWQERDFGNVRKVSLAQSKSHGARALASIIRYGFGLKEVPAVGRVRRFSPSGGNLGSPEAAIVVRSVPGVVPGVYHYLAHSDTFAYLGEIGPSVAEAVPDGDHEVLLVATGAIERIARKYGVLSLKICLLDAGCALTQVAHAAADRGVTVTAKDHWNDETLSSVLRNDRTQHPIMAVVGMTGFERREL